tara:strand:- start:380 stop:781 length:402 start_codon:yes stop_codon:yes gene_type:complete
MKLIIKFGFITISSHLLFIFPAFSENKFKLKEIPNFNLEEIREDIPALNDPFISNDDFDYQQNPFKNLSIKLIALFKVEDELNVMIRTLKGLGNYQVGDKIYENISLKQIDILDKEIVVTDGISSYTYKLNKK